MRLQQLGIYQIENLDLLIDSHRWDESILSAALNQNDARSRSTMNSILQDEVVTTLESAGRNDELCEKMWCHIEGVALHGNLAAEGHVLRFTRGKGALRERPAQEQVLLKLILRQWPPVRLTLT